MTAGQEVMMNRQSDKITALYTRVDRGNAPGIASEAITAQQKTLLRYAEDQGLDNVQIFSDSGYNGITDQRPAFQKLLKAIKSCEVDKLVVLSVDRLYRDYAKCEQLVTDILPRHGIELYALRERISPQTPLVFFFPALSSFVGGEQ